MTLRYAPCAPSCDHLSAIAVQPGEFDESLQVPPDYCGSCYGAKGAPSANGLCCNTCKEVANAYTAMGWALHEIRRTAEQVTISYQVT